METECFTQEELEKLAYVLKAVAHPNRLKIICLLSKNGEMSVSDICDRVDFASPDRYAGEGNSTDSAGGA